MPNPLEIMNLALWLANRFSMQHGLQPADREDCRQEAALSCLQAFLKYDPRLGPAAPYVRISVLRALALWYHRRRMIRTPDRFRRLPQPVLTQLEDEPAMPDEEDTDDSFAILHRLVHLCVQLESLPDRILLTHVLAGETVSQVAGVLGVTRQSAYARKVRVLRQLKKLWPVR